MSEPSVTPETIGAAENTAGAEGSTAQETSSGFWWETSDTPSGGPTPAEAAPAAAPGPVPYDEFRRAQTERTQFKSELEGYREYDPLLNWARENNVTPQQALQLLTSPPQTQAPAAPLFGPEAEFHRYLQANQIDPEFTDTGILNALKDQWQRGRGFEQKLTQFEQFMQSQERTGFQTELRSEMAQVQREFPQLEDPRLQMLVYNRFAVDAEANPQGASMRQSAAAVMDVMRDVAKRAVADYARGKQVDSVAPNPSGGNSPAPTAPLNTAKMTESERSSLVSEQLRLALQQPQ